jgi:hypothetical protein
MKSLLTLMMTTGILLLNSCQETSEKQMSSITKSEFDEAKEKDAIMSVIEQETRCFFERNYECWKGCWIDEDYAFLAWNGSDGTYYAALGWDEINNGGKAYIDAAIKNNPEGQSVTSHPIVKRENIQFKFYNEKLAFLVWKQYNSNRTNDFFQVSQDTRLMEKRDGQWKIVNVSAYWDYKNNIPFADLKLEES